MISDVELMSTGAIVLFESSLVLIIKYNAKVRKTEQNNSGGKMNSL